MYYTTDDDDDDVLCGIRWTSCRPYFLPANEYFLCESSIENFIRRHSKNVLQYCQA